MTMEQLVARAKAALAQPSGHQTFTLVLPGWSRGHTARLLGTRGPRGEVVSHFGTEARPEQLVSFDAAKVLKWLRAEGLTGGEK